MKRTVIVNIPMTIAIQRKRYQSSEPSLKVSERTVAFPVIAFLEEQIRKEDEITCILILKRSGYDRSDENAGLFEEEMNAVSQKAGASIRFLRTDSEFSEERSVHEKLMARIVEQMENDSHIILDMTYGPKDLPIVEFSALAFAERFLRCHVDHIIYGQGFFNEKNELVETRICDLSPLYSLHSLTNTLSCNDPDRARTLLRSIIAL
ncbi:MAG: hypothetical protein IJ106_05460 [Parasporobacterium sp.]|nr:hypothetical protein [Parasporobacterium sp.]